jgi:amino acid transporter
MDHIYIKSIIIFVIVLVVIVPVLGYAGVEEITTLSALGDFATRIEGIMQFVLFSISGIFIAVAGYQYLTAGGDPEKTKNARNTILYVIYAIGAGLLALFLPQLIVNIL